MSYEAIAAVKKDLVHSIIQELDRNGVLTDRIKKILLKFCSTTIESDMNTIRKGSSCPAGCIPLVFCSCGTLNRDCFVYCPKSENPRCTHLTRSFSNDATVVFYYPVMNGLLDSIFSGNDEFMHSLTNRERLVNTVYASENDIICQDLSVNTYSASRCFGDDRICSVLRQSLDSRKSPLSHMNYLIPDVHFAKKLSMNGIKLWLLLLYRIYAVIVGYQQAE